MSKQFFVLECKPMSEMKENYQDKIVLGPSYGQRTLKDIQLQHVFGGEYKNVWDANAANCGGAPVTENYAPSFNSYQNPYNPYADKVKLALLK